MQASSRNKQAQSLQEGGLDEKAKSLLYRPIDSDLYVFKLLLHCSCHTSVIKSQKARILVSDKHMSAGIHESLACTYYGNYLWKKKSKKVPHVSLYTQTLPGILIKTIILENMCLGRGV